jgi:hypothetical protein
MTHGQWNAKVRRGLALVTFEAPAEWSRGRIVGHAHWYRPIGFYGTLAEPFGYPQGAR